MQTDYYKDFTILHRVFDMGSDSTKFTGASRYYLISTVIFSCFISLAIRGYKINKFTKLLNMIISIESYTMNMDVKILPDPRYDLNMLQKNYQALSLQDILIMHLTLHELAY